MIDIQIEQEFFNKWLDIKLGCIECDVNVEKFNENLWNEIRQQCQSIQNEIQIEDISKIAAIRSSRRAYKALGKDPARYRLSAEALIRRVVKGIELYQINNVVDLVNLASVTSEFSIGGYDVDNIVEPVELGIGKKNEPYCAIGRGELNIEFLPVLRDFKGAFGSPTSDSDRTCVTEKTKHFLMVYFGFGSYDTLQTYLNQSVKYLKDFAAAENIKIQIK
jgi:DNA/RNA-binding domain of Phe-tRNA-synthetase-like protein